jgi:hypothetical protein
MLLSPPPITEPRPKIDNIRFHPTFACAVNNNCYRFRSAANVEIASRIKRVVDAAGFSEQWPLADPANMSLDNALLTI